MEFRGDVYLDSHLGAELLAGKKGFDLKCYEEGPVAYTVIAVTVCA